MPNFKNTHVAILCAMPEEIGAIIKHLRDLVEYKYGDLVIFSGYFENKKSDKPIKLTVAWSGWGKVSVARAATRIIGLQKSSPINLFLFTGVAGGVGKNINQWDIILPNALIQHDMDARPLFEKYVIPALKKSVLIPNRYYSRKITEILENNIDNINLNKFGKLINGTIATGDKFISDKDSISNIQNDLNELVAVEMEGAAFAQVAEQEKINWYVLRVISDNADSSASQNFSEFIIDYKNHSWNLIQIILQNLF